MPNLTKKKAKLPALLLIDKKFDLNNINVNFFFALPT